ncbi:hypothetical protein BY458DRAFT_543946 [Sporodiniella umbellata]|nr:hypothetical protein BY458DRAFT_543946 [Sporodiniella umbellata]
MADTITREKAVCLFYNEKYTPKKADKLLKKLQSLHVDICYDEDLTKPKLVYMGSIFTDPGNNHTYPTNSEVFPKKSPASKEINIDECFFLESKMYRKPTKKKGETANIFYTPDREQSSGGFVANYIAACKKSNNNRNELNTTQSAQFLNTIFMPTQPVNSEMYERKDILSTDMLEIAKAISEPLKTIQIRGFGSWCLRKDVYFIRSASSKTYIDGIPRTFRSLYVLKEKYLGPKLDEIHGSFLESQQYTQDLLKDDYKVIGAARSLLEDESTQRKLINIAMKGAEAKLRMGLNSVFTDYSFLSETEMEEEPWKYTRTKGCLKDLISETQGKSYVCIALDDFEDLASDRNELKDLLIENPNIKKIIMVKPFFKEETHVYSSEEIVDSIESENTEKLTRKLKALDSVEQRVFNTEFFEKN